MKRLIPAIKSQPFFSKVEWNVCLSNKIPGLESLLWIFSLLLSVFFFFTLHIALQPTSFWVGGLQRNNGLFLNFFFYTLNSAQGTEVRQFGTDLSEEWYTLFLYFFKWDFGKKSEFFLNLHSICKTNKKILLIT